MLHHLQGLVDEGGEIVDELVSNQRGKVKSTDKNTRYLLKNVRGLARCAEGGEEHVQSGSDAEDPLSEAVPPPLPGRSAPRLAVQTPATDGKDGEEGDEVPGETQITVKPVVAEQTTIKKLIDNQAQKELDIAWAEAMFRAGIPFNFLNFDTTQALHETYLKVASARPKVKLPSYKHMRTVMVDYIYLKVQKAINTMTACWETTDCTFITVGSTDRKNRPVMNFLPAGEKGAVLVTTVFMTGRKKNAAALAKLWEQVMREIGLQRINAICTDNAEVNKKAAQILERWTDKDVAKISWVPCGAHCCGLLLKDLSNLQWVKKANTIVKFIRNHHSTHGLMMTIDDSLSLLRPTEVRFGSVYQMLGRLVNREHVLNDMVDENYGARWRALRWSSAKLQKKTDLVYYSLRCESWWDKVKKIVAIMEPMFSLLKRMDKEGVSPTNLVEYDDLIARRLTNVVLTKKEREDVMAKVKDRVQMMRQPAHAAAFLLDPQRRQPGWLNDPDSALTIAIRVLGMWSTATSAERNWASIDFVHSKRRNNLSPASLEKLVYIHWNMQLLCVRTNKDNGYVDVWGSFFEPLMKPTEEDQSLDDGTTEKTVDEGEEEKRQKRLKKAPKGRIPRDLLDEDSSGSSELEDLIWKGKCWNESTSEESNGEADIGEDSDFELGAVPTVPATAYVGRMRGRREKEAEVQPSEPVERVDTDIEFLMHRVPDGDRDADEDEADRGKAMADRDAALVQMRMLEDEARH
ncbi:hypothetical protein CBR_g30070 [Chara braunii]|uniref:DUF659 domain-containing protein n=1 Tax=Chara braunii TaxID=69332 RepID=A0A388LBV6_CHABU|nr:hypothetical protein CBR_g30070 [Chara braunii]|eukprot:GBG79807.1 hypothetical protein CBR_g30070 [Chara braunii]